MGLRVYVTQSLTEPGLERIRSLGDEEVFPYSAPIAPRKEVLRGVRGADVLCCLLQDRIDAEVIDVMADNLEPFLSGLPLPNLLNPEVIG